MSSRHPRHLAEMIRDRSRVAATALVLSGGAPAVDPGTGTAPLTDAFNIIAILDGGGVALSVGKQVDIVIDMACVIEAWAIVADVVTTTRVDVWRDAFVAFPPVAADGMPGVAANRPTITADDAARSDNVSAWTRIAIDAGDVLRFNVDTNSAAMRLTIALKARRAS